MKKSQVLAALALAFALGVVAPVVSTTNTVSAYTAADATAKPPVQGSATAEDVKNAISAVRANATYKNMVALKEESDKLTGTDPEYIDNLDGAGYGLYDALKGLAAREGGDATKNLTDFYTPIDNDYWNKKITFSQEIAKLVQRAESTAYYDVMAPIFKAYNKGANPDKDAFVKAILAFNAQFKNNNASLDINTSNVVYADILSGVKTVFNAKLKDVYNVAAGTDFYEGYQTLCEAAIAAKEDNTKYTNGYNAITTALRASGVLNKDGLVQLAKVEAGDGADTKYVALSSLLAIATNNTYSDYNAWVATPTTSMYNVIENAEKSIYPVDCNENYDTIIDIATAYAQVTGNNVQTVQQIAATLVGYKAPAAQNTLTEGPVTVTGAFPADLKLSVVKSDKKVAAFGDAKYGMWDINLIDAKNNKVTFNGSVMVTIAVPEGIDAAKSSVYFVTDDGKVEKLAARVENGKMVFTTSHFSLYAIVEDNGKNFGIGAPDTGIVMNSETGATTTVAMVAGVATALTAAGAGVVAYRNARRSTRK